MALIAINADAGGAGPSGALAALDAALAALPEGRTPIVMLHGYRFSPSVPGQSPHDHIFSFTPDPTCWKAVSWPRLLGVAPEGPGLALAFGWEARGSLWAAYAEAAHAGAVLAGLLDRIARAVPGRTIGIVAHSLGARVALQALARVRAPMAARLVLLAPAEFRGATVQALAQSRGAEVLNVIPRANLPFDMMLRACRPHGGPTLGRGLPGAGRHWLDLALDQPDMLDRLAALGYNLPRPGPRVCHWNSYLRPGVFELYRAVLQGNLPLAALRRALPAPPAAPPAHRTAPLPAAQTAPS